MKFPWVKSLVVVLATTEAVGASNWFSKAVYNKWHQTELERWLSDHNIPYPTPADRKELEHLIKANWESNVQVPLAHVSETTPEHLSNVKDWIFDSWPDTRLKAFLDRHGVPHPQSRKRDTILQAARDNYEAIAKKLGETIGYPGNWLYEQWSDSDLKEWLDERGWPIPQPTTRDRLIAAVRRNARLASLTVRNAVSSASASAASAQATLSDALFNAWSDSELKKFLDEHGVKVPQGSRRNELMALARKHRASLINIRSSATSILGAATTNAGNEYARATEDVQLKVDEVFDSTVQAWSNSRLKAYLDARGIPVPQGGKRDELLAKVRLNKDKAASGYNAWTFDTWDVEDLKKYLSSMNNKMANRAGATRDDLVRHAQDSYAKASKAGDSGYASVTSYLSRATDAITDTTFNTWSQSDLKNYLNSYGIPAYQGSDINELRAYVRRNAQYFHYGTTTPQGTIFARVKEGAQWLLDQLRIGASSGRAQGHDAANAAKEKVERTTSKIREEL